MAELSRNIRDMKSILYGNSEAEPVAEACAQLTQEFFKEDTLRLLITCLPKLNLEVANISPLGKTAFLRYIRLRNRLFFFVIRLGKMLHKLLPIYRGNRSIHG